MSALRESWLEEVRAHARRMRAALEEADKVWDRTDLEARDKGRHDRAVMLSKLADKRLKEAEELWRQQKERERTADLRKRARAPPSLQDLVLAHGTYDMITSEAWAKFDSDMEVWKSRIRSGDEFLEEQNALRQADEAENFGAALGLAPLRRALTQGDKR